MSRQSGGGGGGGGGGAEGAVTGGGTGAAGAGGEEGSALLRFQVRRDGYVLAYQLTRSTGHAALDAAIDQMMRGAKLPPFPAGMTQTEIAVSVPIRFNLSR